MMNFTMGGDHQFGKIKADWTASYSKASEERPNERYIVYEAEDLTFQLISPIKALQRLLACLPHHQPTSVPTIVW
jgi:hypothetical protein